MSRIANCFAALNGKKALIPFITAGDPQPAVTVELMHGLVDGGADIIELGVPFSDPMADGPVIQRASERALAHRVGLKNVLEMVAEFRQRNSTTPVVLMGYLNPVCAMGYTRFAEQAKASKLDIVDTETFKDDSSTSFTNQLTKAKQAGATMVFAPIYYTPASVLLKNAKDMGYDVKMMGCDGMDGILGVEGFDTSLAEGLLLMTPFSADDEKNADFVKAHKEAYDETPNQFAADAYDCVHAIVEAIDRAGIDITANGADIAGDLAPPVVGIVHRLTAAARAIMAMPEAAMHKNRLAPTDKSHIRRARQLLAVQAITHMAQFAQQGAHLALWRGVARGNGAHGAAARGGGVWPGHVWPCPRAIGSSR